MEFYCNDIYYNSFLVHYIGGDLTLKGYIIILNPRLRSPRRPLLATGFRVHAHPADSAATPRQTHAHRTTCSPLQTHARAWCWGRIDPSTRRRRTPPETGYPLVIIFMVARGTQGATRATRPRCAIHACTHRSALPSCRVPLSHAGCARGGRAGGRTPGWVALGLVSPAHTQRLFTLPEVVELPTSIVPIVPHTLCYLLPECM